MNPPRLRAPVLTSLLLIALTNTAQAQQPEPDDLDPASYTYAPVITPTRLRQSLMDVPASVTIITAETIQRYGITRIEEALRLVPGMAVSQATGNAYRINYHGTDASNPRRMNVLVDGVSAYRQTLSLVPWDQLPVALEDIDRIEVTRGANSAAYGPNSMMAVVNIITKHPQDVAHATAVVSAGSHHALGTTARVATKLGEHTHLSLTADRQRDSGYDNMTLSGGPHDSSQVKRLNARSQTEFGDGSTLTMQLAHMEGQRQIGYTADFFQSKTSFPDQDSLNTQASLTWTKPFSANHEVQVKAFHDSMRFRQVWTSCPYRIGFYPITAEIAASNPRYLGFLAFGDASALAGVQPDPALVARVIAAINAIGGFSAAFTPVCGTTNQNLDETRSQVEMQDTFVVSDTLRVVGGFGLRHQIADSEVYFSGRQSNMVRWAFAHGEYRPTSALAFNLGGYQESNSLGNSTFSPRAAVNYHLSDAHSVRAVYSQGTRTPDLGEKRGRWVPTYEDLDPALTGGLTRARPLVLFTGNAELEEERVTTVELGYMMASRQSGLVWDTRLFRERLTNLISQYITYDSLGATNNGRVNLQGIETQVSWEASRKWSGWVNYSYLLNTRASTPIETLQHSQHSGGFGVSRAISDSWRASLASYAASGNGYYEDRFARTDLTLSYTFLTNTQPGSVSLGMSYLHTPTVSTYVSSIGSYRASYNDRLSVRGRLLLAF